ncbi:MAG TPA: amidohydrolase family protein [Candidatus Acidoferrales bacterium]|nr:amidohydrolase family protein [Candidatus Acidoferrales bacterium]
MRTITLEEHFSTPEVLKATTKDAGAVPEFMKLLQARLLDLGQGRIADMDASGIDVQVLSLAASGLDKLEPATATALARDTNDTLAAAVKAHPDRFAAFGTLALLEPEKAAAEFERCIRQLGFKGIMLNGTTNGLFLDHPSFTPLFESAQHLDVPIYLHPAPPPQPVQEAYYRGLPGNLGFFLSTAAWGWHVETGMHCLRLIVSGLFDRFPKLKIIIGHMGEDLPYSIVRAEDVFARGAKHLQRRIAEYFQEHFHITTSGYFTLPPYLCALQVVGADRILFSVDYPFSANAAGREFLKILPASREDLEKIAHRNAECLLKL